MPPFELRDYQQNICIKIWDAIESGENALLQAPTGSGKTAIVAAMTDKLIREVPGRRGRVLILIDREILARQLRESIKKFFPHLNIGIVCSSVDSNKDCSQQVTIASRQTLINCLGEMPPVHLIILDEAHLLKPPREGVVPDQYAKIISKLRDYNEQMRLFGCSATPYRLNNGFIFGNKHHPLDQPYFQKVTASITYKELTDAAHLSPLIGEIPENGIDLSNVSLVAGEYNLGELSAVMGQHIGSVQDAIEKYATDRKSIMIFAVDIEHCKKLTEIIPDSIAYHSKLKKADKIEAMDGFKTGKYRIIVSVATLTTGFDYPAVSCVILVRPTKSPALYLQMVGRGLRTAEGKKNCLLIDLTGNTKDHLPTNSLDTVFVKIPAGTGTEGETPYKMCPGLFLDGSQCLAELHPKMVFCHVCGFEFKQLEISKLPDLKTVTFDKAPEPVDYKVNDVTYHRHLSRKSEKELVCIQYDCGGIFNPKTVCDYLCLPDFYTGYPVEKARTWWKERSADPFPENIEEALFLANELIKPISITIIKDGKYDRITDYQFEDNEEYDEEAYQAFLARQENESTDSTGNEVTPF